MNALAAYGMTEGKEMIMLYLICGRPKTGKSLFARTLYSDVLFDFDMPQEFPHRAKRSIVKTSEINRMSAEELRTMFLGRLVGDLEDSGSVVIDCSNCNLCTTPFIEQMSSLALHKDIYITRTLPQMIYPDRAFAVENCTYTMPCRLFNVEVWLAYKNPLISTDKVKSYSLVKPEISSCHIGLLKRKGESQ